jgi:predicted MFS family arabinose efflux permease
MRGGSLVRIALHAVPFLLSLLFQVSFGFDALTAGLLILAVFAGNLVMKIWTTPILRRFSFRSVLIVNGALNAAAIFACMLITAQTPIAVVAVLLFLSGLTRSMQFTAINTLAFAEVPQERMSGANTLANMAHQMSIGAGIALGAVALRAAEVFNPSGAGTSIPAADFQVAFAVLGILSVIATLDALRLDPAAGNEIRKAARS